SIDTTTSGGKLIFHIFGALAEFERDLIRERTQAGLAAARARGRKGGRPRAIGLNDERKRAMAQSLYNDKHNSIGMICDTLHISRATLYRYIKCEETRLGVVGEQALAKLAQHGRVEARVGKRQME